MSLKYAIMGLLNIKPMSGYSLKKNFDGPMSGFWSVSYGGLYPALERLENQKLINGKTDSEDPRNKKVYYITGKGKEELQNWFFNDKNVIKYKDEYMLKLFLSKDLDNEERRELVDDYIYFKKKLLNQIKQTVKKSNNTHPGIKSVVKYSRETLRKEIRVLSDIKKDLE